MYIIIFAFVFLVTVKCIAFVFMCHRVRRRSKPEVVESKPEVVENPKVTHNCCQPL